MCLKMGIASKLKRFQKFDAKRIKNKIFEPVHEIMVLIT